MGRKASLTPKKPITVWLPEELRTRMDLMLYSELEERVPHGKHSEFLTLLLRHYFEDAELDLSPYMGTLPGEVVVRSSKLEIERLKKHLEKK